MLVTQFEPEHVVPEGIRKKCNHKKTCLENSLLSNGMAQGAEGTDGCMHMPPCSHTVETESLVCSQTGGKDQEHLTLGPVERNA